MQLIPVLLGVIACAAVPAAVAQDLVLRGGFLYDAVGDHRVPNRGVVVGGGKLLEVGADLDGRDLSGVRVIDVADDATLLPGLFDLHAHHGMDLFGAGRVDEVELNPRVFLANGVTSVFPAGEMNPEKMRSMRLRIERGELPGPRVFSSGPYFGSARPGWNRRATRDDIHAEVDALVESGVRGFKAKGIGPEQLRALIERAHRYGLTVTGHLGSGYRGSVNPRDAIAMGIDRVEHFLGGDAFPADRSAYASFEQLDVESAAFADVCRLFVERGVFYDATITAYGYYGERDPEVFTPWIDETRFLTPYMREQVAGRGERRVLAQFERIYRVKHRSLKAFFDAGGGPWITLGTDRPSAGEDLSGFSAHREMHALSRTGIPNAAVLRIATINGARALGVGDRLGTLEPGKLADLIVVRGDPLTDIRATRDVMLVVRGGDVFDPRELLAECEGRIGPADESERTEWVMRWPRRGGRR